MALVRIDNRKDAHLKHHVVVQVGCEVDHLGSKQLTTVNGGSESWQTALYRWSRPRFSLLRNRTTIATIPSLSHAHLDHVTKVHVLAPAARQGVLDALESPKKIENLLVLQDRVVVDNTVDRSVQAVVEAKDVFSRSRIFGSSAYLATALIVRRRVASALPETINPKRVSSLKR
jgi:hypothetical protein